MRVLAIDHGEARTGAATDVPVDTYDERLTTRMAASSARGGASAPPDALAAAHLLESYLASRGSDA
jgi:RNase H-fold protein (predicted Holliday junction resolvase)